MTSTRTAGLLNAGLRLAAFPLICVALTACGTTKVATTEKKPRSKEYFAESVYGVKASPRVADGKNIPKGGGRLQVGKPYMVKGKWYTPKEEPGYSKVGVSSWYGSAFHGRLTANGEVYDKEHLSAAHPTFPLPSYARVTNLENGSSVVVRVNDRGPYEYNRLIDVSSKTADVLDIKRKGSAQVRVEYVGLAPLQGNDMPYLMASYVKKGDRTPSSLPGGGQIASGVMVASNEPLAKQTRDLGVLTIPAKSHLAAAPHALALTEPSRAPIPFAIAPSGGEMVQLPDIGPVPRERPAFKGGVAYAAAYAEVGREKPNAFNALLANTDPETRKAIAGEPLRRHSKR